MKHSITTPLLLASLLLGGALHAAVVIGFEPGEGYSAGNLAGQPSSGTQWVRTNGSDDSMISVNATAGVGGTAGLINQQGGGSDFTYYRLQPTNADLGLTFDADSSILSYSFQWRLNDTSFGSATGSPVFQFAMGGTSNTTNDAVLHIEVRNSGRFFVNHGGGNLAVDNRFTPQTWHTISGTVNYATNTFTVFLDNVQQFTTTNGGNLTFRTGSVENTDIYLANRNAKTDNAAYLNWSVDNLSIVPEPATIALLLGLAALGVALARRRR